MSTATATEKRRRPWEYLRAAWLVEAVKVWAGSDYMVLTESVASVVGRIDMLLVPISFQTADQKRQRGCWTDKRRLIGVEVKASREDFLRGLHEGQYERYAGTLGALYVATGREVKTAEVPTGVGHFVVYHPPKEHDYRCVCKRHATFRDYEIDADTWWRLIDALADEVRTARRELRDRCGAIEERVGDVFRRAMGKVIESARSPSGAGEAR